MRRAHTVEQVRAAEGALMEQLPSGALMQRAAVGLAAAVADWLGSSSGSPYGARVVLLVGSGDNGGDALWAGAHLARRGVQVEAVLLSDRAHPEGLAALRAAGGRAVLAADVAEVRRPDLVVDGILGIGGRPGLRKEAVAVLGRFEGVPVVAVDVPSGIDVDTGRIDGPHVRADLTVTFGTHKVAHLVDPGAEVCGALHLVDIGLDPLLADVPPVVEALQPADVAALLPVPGPFDHKYTRGVVGVRAGSERYPGAAVLCTSGAACGLAGMVRYVGSAADQVKAVHPEIVGGGRVQAWVVGSGTDDSAAGLLDEAMADGVPVLADADAIEHVPAATGRAPGVPVLITPHAGELAALRGVDRAGVEADQLRCARETATELGVTVLSKGRHTLCAAPDGRVRVTTSGTPWLGTAGAGDVLAGLCGALLAAGLDPFDAGSVGSWVHGAAAQVASAGGPIVAHDVAQAIPSVVRALLDRSVEEQG